MFALYIWAAAVALHIQYIHMYVRTHMDGWVDACRYVQSSHV